MMHEPGKSDRPIVPANPANTRGSRPIMVEWEEGRDLAKENSVPSPQADRTQSRVGNDPEGLHQALERIRQAARRDKEKPAAGTWPSGRGTQFNEDGGGLHFAMDPNSNEIAALWGKSLDCPNPCEEHPWYEAYVKYSYDDGATWTGTFNISNMVNDIDRTPTGAYDAAGNLHVIWEGFCCDHQLRMRYRGRVGGAWGPIQRLSEAVGGYVPDSLVARGEQLYCTFSNTNVGAGLYDVMYTTYTPSGPRLALSQTALNRTVWITQVPSDDTFTVANSCPGTLNYTIITDAPWLSVSPSAGSVNSTPNTITVSYPGASTLLRGTYTGRITISGNAANSPQTVLVTLTIQTVSADHDGDGDVDQGDFGFFQACLSGTSFPQYEPACQWARLDGDTDIDQTDLATFLRCFSGPDQIPDPACINP